MAYRRGSRKTWSFEAKTPTGWKQLSTRTPNKLVAQRMEAMWGHLAELRQWDLLLPVLEGHQKIGELYDLWESSGQKPHEMRRALEAAQQEQADPDLEPAVAEWHKVYCGDHPDTDSPAHALVHVRALLPAGQVRKVSTVSTSWLTQQLYAYPGSPGTRRKVHSSWSVFLGYCTEVKGLFAVNPMPKVKKPKPRKQPIMFYELDAVKRIVEAQPDPARRALFALLYGTGCEVSVALGLTRADVDPTRKEIRAAGTKTHTRDRMARVAEWAWPIFWAYAKDFLPVARLWREGLTRFTVSDWHRETVRELKLPSYPLKNARHHWAVRMLRGGAPVHVVQWQLGHSTAKLTLDTYGRWMPGSEDRARAEAQVTQFERLLTSTSTSREHGGEPGSTVSSFVAIAAG